MKKLLTIDLSTTCTGWSLWDMDEKLLLDFGAIKPNKKGLTKLVYPKKQLAIMRSLAEKLEVLVRSKEPQMIAIEEVNRHKSRMSGKTLDGAHWIFLDRLEKEKLAIVRYFDSDGNIGWRTKLGLRLTENDKRLNLERKRINKKKIRGTSDLPIITKKHLAERFVNQALGLHFEVDKNDTDNDVVDALGLALAIIRDLE